MTPVRLLRIVAIAVGFWFVFGLSQAATAARNAGQTTPGTAWAIGVLSILFLVSAYVAERMQGSEHDARKDFLWGLGAGGLAIVAGRLAA